MLYLPTENELKIELERERKLIEENIKFITESVDINLHRNRHQKKND